MSSEDITEQIVARDQIQELRTKYSRYLDNGDWEAFAGLFTEDAKVQFGDFEPLEGREEILEFASDTISDLYTYSRHTAQMPQIAVNGDRAEGDWYMLVFYEMTEGPEGIITGKYSDEYRRVDGEWKFEYLKNVVERDTGEGEPHLQM